MNPKRKMQLDDQTNKSPEVTVEIIKKYIVDDFQKMSSTIWMILQDDEIIEMIAKKFHEKMESNASKQVADAIQEQKTQLKAN